MSHIVTSEAQIFDLNALETACGRLGLEFVRNQKTFRWWGKHVGDYPIPEGFTENDMGTCDHAIRISGDDRAYEIGVVRRRDGENGYCLMFDFYGRGKGMQDKVAVLKEDGSPVSNDSGQMCEGLVHEYVCAVADQTMGDFWIQDRTQLEDGTMVLEFSV